MPYEPCDLDLQGVTPVGSLAELAQPTCGSPTRNTTPSWLTFTPRDAPVWRDPGRPGHLASALLKERLPDPLVSPLSGRPLAITFVTVGELTQWTFIRHWSPQRKAGLDRAQTDLLPGAEDIPERPSWIAQRGSGPAGPTSWNELLTTGPGSSHCRHDSLIDNCFGQHGDRLLAQAGEEQAQRRPSGGYHHPRTTCPVSGSSSRLVAIRWADDVGRCVGQVDRSSWSALVRRRGRQRRRRWGR